MTVVAKVTQLQAIARDDKPVLFQTVRAIIRKTEMNKLREELSKVVIIVLKVL